MNNNKTKKVVISGYYGFNNFGDEAVLGVLTDSLKKEEVKDITIISKDPKQTRKNYQTKSVYTFNMPGIFFAILRSDVLFSGGGSLLQDVTSSKSLFYYLFIICLALVLGKKVVIFAQGIGPIRNKFSKEVTKKVLKKCSFVTVRDEKSLSMLKNWGVSAELVPDPVWNIHISRKYSHNGVGVQLRRWNTLTDEMLTAIAKSIASTFPKKKIFIYALQKSQDKDVCMLLEEKLREFCPNIYTQVVISRSPDAISDSFSHLDMLISMRYHSCLLGLKYEYKVLPIVYDPKVETLAEEFGLTNRIYLYNEQEIDSAIKRFNSENYEKNEKPLPHFDFSIYREYIK